MTRIAIVDGCCCFGLSRGCYIIGYFNLLGNIIYIGLMILKFEKFCEEIGINFSPGASEGMKAAIRILLTVIGIISLIFNVIFLIGLHKNRRKHVKSYFMFSVCVLVGYAVSLIHKMDTTPGEFNIWGIRLIVSTLFQLYILMVIRSLYLKMDETKGRQRTTAILNRTTV